MEMQNQYPRPLVPHSPPRAATLMGERAQHAHPADAATRPQDRGDFDSQNLLQWHRDLSRRRG